jgi:hypothetical protein
MTTSGHSVSHSTERVERPVGFPLSNLDILKVRSRFDPELDTFNGEAPIKENRWPWPTWIRPKQRIAREDAFRVQLYINEIIRRNYPYHIRALMGQHLWVEFCEYFAVNPDVEKGIRLI